MSNNYTTAYWTTTTANDTSMSLSDFVRMSVPVKSMVPKPQLSPDEIEARLLDTESKLNKALKALEEQTEMVRYLTEIVDEEFKK